MLFFTSSFKPQHFIAFLTIASIFVIGSIVAFNGWFYINKPNSDLKRSFTAEQGQYDIIVIGSSRANAYAPFYENLASAPRTLNLSAGGATPYEIKRRLEHSIKFSMPKKIIIGLDFFSFNSYWPGSKTFTESYFTAPDTRFLMLHRIMRFTKYSFDYRTFINNVTGLRKLSEETENEAEETADSAVNINAFLTTETFYMGDGYNPTPYKQYKEDDQVFNAFREILDIGYANDINVILITSPIHSRLLQIIDIMGLWPEMEQWKKNLLRTNQELASHYNREPFPIYDAMIYTNNTTVDITQSESLYREASHFTPAFASAILGDIERDTHQNTSNYVILSTDNFDTHIRMQTQERDAHNKKTDKLFQELSQKYEAHLNAKILLGME